MELALVLPMVMTAALLVLQVGLVARDQVLVTHAAREAARSASVNPDSQHVEAVGRRILRDAEVSVEARGKIGDALGVEVTYISHTDLPLIGVLLPDPVLSSRVVVSIER